MIKRSIHGEYVSILKSPSTLQSGDRLGFEMASNNNLGNDYGCSGCISNVDKADCDRGLGKLFGDRIVTS